MSILQAPADGIIAGVWQPPCRAQLVTMGTGIQVRGSHSSQQAAMYRLTTREALARGGGAKK